MKLTNFLRWIILSISGIFLAACGFHLPQHYQLPPQLQQVYVTSNAPEYANFAEQLKTRLAVASVSTVSNIKEAKYILHVLNINATPNTQSSSTTGQINTYNLVYTVEFDVIDAQGDVILNKQSVQSNAQYTISSQQLLATFNQDDNYIPGLQQATINQILFRLSSQQVKKQVEN